MSHPFEDLEDFNLSESVLKKLSDPDYIARELAEGKSMQEIFDYDEKTMHAFYEVAYGLFQKQAYKEAADAFFFLSNLNPYIPTFWLGLGMSEHLNHHYDSAIMAYNMAILTDPTNPLPHYHAAACYLAVKDASNALASYDLAIQICGDNPSHSSLKEQSYKAKERI